MTTTKRILVTGSRDWTDVYAVEDVLNQIMRETPLHENIIVVHGQCPRGADDLADRWARTWNAIGVIAERHPADWEKHGKSAGFIRNKHMVDLGADQCVAFILNDSKGATHCADLAEKAGIPTLRIKVYTHGLSDPEFPSASLSVGSDGGIL